MIEEAKHIALIVSGIAVALLVIGSLFIKD